MQRRLAKVIIAILAFAIVFSVPGAASANELPTLPTIKQVDHEFMEAAEQRIFQLINDLRQNPGSYSLNDGTKVSSIHSAVPALQQKNVIKQAARYKTLYMAAYDDFSHTYTAGPYTGGSMQLYSYSWWGENIAGFSPKLSTAEQCGERLFNQWLNSSGHLSNMMNSNFTYIGIGVVSSPNSKYKVLGTQQFGSGSEPKLTVNIPNPMSVGGSNYEISADDNNSDGNNTNDDNSASIKYGWQQSGGIWYFRLASGSYAKGWLKDGNTWYFLDKSTGAMKTGWLQDGSSWYYMKSSGVMAIGWQKVGNTWYFLKSSGAMSTGWLKDGSTWYYLGGNGAMLTGWQKIGGSWYYIAPSGVMATGWQQVGGKWYWLAGNGVMTTGTRVINSVTYTFDASGALIQ